MAFKKKRGARMGWSGNGRGRVVETGEGLRLQKKGVNMAFQSLPRVFIAMEQRKPV